MDSILINGNKKLKGDIKISGAKNAALPILCCSLLSSERSTVSNIPKLADIYTMHDLLSSLGASINVTDKDDEYVYQIDPSKINNLVADYEIVRKMRASIWVLAPLLARFGKAKVSLPGGCAIGARPVDMHISVLEAMGAEIHIEQGYIIGTSSSRLKACHYSFDKVSVGATITAVMAASLATGESLFYNCAREPEVIDVCHYLQSMGAEIEGIATSEIKIIGKENLSGASYQVIPDRIEAVTYMIAALITKGELKITGINYHIVENFALKLINSGAYIKNYDNFIEVKWQKSLAAIDIQTEPYPGIATDAQAQFMSLMCLAEGTSIITENIFENRFMHVSELNRLGAHITINSNNAIVRGVTKLTGAEVMASDLRASSSLVLAALAAEGETKIRRVYHLDRGYQDLVQKLSACGADIRRVQE